MIGGKDKITLGRNQRACCWPWRWNEAATLSAISPSAESPLANWKEQTNCTLDCGCWEPSEQNSVRQVGAWARDCVSNFPSRLFIRCRDSDLSSLCVYREAPWDDLQRHTHTLGGLGSVQLIIEKSQEKPGGELYVQTHFWFVFLSLFFAHIQVDAKWNALMNNWSILW